MNDLLVKNNALPSERQQEVDDFLDFLLRRHQGKENFDIKIWKEKIKNVSVWTEEEIKIFDEIEHDASDARRDDYYCEIP